VFAILRTKVALAKLVRESVLQVWQAPVLRYLDLDWEAGLSYTADCPLWAGGA
jgi:hypothetical protein